MGELPSQILANAGKSNSGKAAALIRIAHMLGYLMTPIITGWVVDKHSKLSAVFQIDSRSRRNHAALLLQCYCVAGCYSYSSQILSFPSKSFCTTTRSCYCWKIWLGLYKYYLYLPIDLFHLETGSYVFLYDVAIQKPVSFSGTWQGLRCPVVKPQERHRTGLRDAARRWGKKSSRGEKNATRKPVSLGQRERGALRTGENGPACHGAGPRKPSPQGLWPVYHSGHHLPNIFLNFIDFF